jgi:hypothetical protein
VIWEAASSRRWYTWLLSRIAAAEGRLLGDLKEYDEWDISHGVKESVMKEMKEENEGHTGLIIERMRSRNSDEYLGSSR